MTQPLDVAELRSQNQARGLSSRELPDQPIELWRRWLRDAEAAGLAEPNAMVVATVDPDGTPSCRTVLCKGADTAGFVFFTNYRSRKGVALASEPRASLLFGWVPLARQVIVTGEAAQVSRAESQAYFATRDRDAQLSASASAQSSVVASREELERRVEELRVIYAGVEVPCPPHWGGFRVRPATIEFWQGRTGRLHDRLRYCRGGDDWVVERLSP